MICSHGSRSPERGAAPVERVELRPRDCLLVNPFHCIRSVTSSVYKATGYEFSVFLIRAVMRRYG
jgi:hypothetical protein